ncbi:MAG: site-specific DNA-methyltransferase [Fimbriimonadales bacterium]|nr:MAG: methyltransferase [Fimbriimonadales bacterium]
MASSNACCAQVYIADSRTMAETPDESVALIVTSPPYWHIKDYGTPCQIGYGQTLHEYLYDLSRVWRECWRVLMPGRRLCINIGDQFARANLYGQYKVIPLHAEIIAQCETIGFDYLGAIIWQKKTTMRPSGGAVVMGSFPYPPNGIVELDYEYILLFRKPGKSPGVSAAAREASALTTDEWKTLFSGHWQFAGERQTRHEAMFPEELPRRLIRMFSLVGETVLDPFVGSGTTLQAALTLNRNAIGYEIQPDFVPLIRQRLGADSLLPPNLSVHLRETPLTPVEPPAGYAPRIKDAAPVDARAHAAATEEKTYRITAAVRFEGETPILRTDEGVQVALLGVRVPAPLQTRALNYLKTYVAGKRVLLRFEGASDSADSPRLSICILPTDSSSTAK